MKEEVPLRILGLLRQVVRQQHPLGHQLLAEHTLSTVFECHQVQIHKNQTLK